MLNRAVKEAFIPFTEPLEGRVNYMYLDVKGLVTTGIGNLIDSPGAATGLEWLHPNGAPATFDEIRAEWQLVKNTPSLAMDGHLAAKAITRLRLTDDAVTKLVLRKVDEFYAILAGRFTDIDSWPADAVLATLSLSWAVGPHFRWTALVEALKVRKWQDCALHCHINETGNPGVIPRNVANKLMYMAAHDTEKRNPLILHGWKPKAPPSLEVGTIAWVQSSLNALVPGLHLDVDGKPGPKTKAALVAFQAANGLSADGIYGPLTRAKIEELLALVHG